MRTNPIVGVQFKNSFTSQENEPRITSPNVTTSEPAKKHQKSLQFVTSAIALAAIVTSAVAIKRGNGNGSEAKETLTGLKNEIANLKTMLSDSSTSGEKLLEKYEQLVDKYNKLSSQLDKVKDVSEKIEKINSIQESLKEIEGKLSEKIGYPTKIVTINGHSFPFVANVLNGVEGESKVAMEKTLQTEAARRIFGISNGLKDLPENGMIRIPTSEIRPYSSTGGMSAVPKEIAENLAKVLAGKQNLKVVVDAPLYLGRYEKNVFLELVENKSNGVFKYIKKSGNKEEILAKLELIDEMKVPIHSANGIEEETVRLFKSESFLNLNIDDITKNMSPKSYAEMEKIIDTVGTYNNKGLIIEKDNAGKLKAYTKIQNIFYDNRKFHLDIPVETYTDGSRDAVNIYSNKSFTAGETERFIYFDKFFYEGLLKGKNAKEPLSAELIIGNDWQTGGISAMIRQLTTVRKYYDIDPATAEKLQNTPIITIMHNAGLSGGVWHSQSKLLNILFGEHATTIAENSWMPNIYNEVQNSGKRIVHDGLPAGLHNGLMENEGLNPQMMAAAYSDFIVPVSNGYAKEISTSDFYGGARKPIFELRMHANEFYNNPDNMKILARQNGIPEEELVNIKPTMVGIVNGCDRINNALNDKAIEKIAKFASIEKSAINKYESGKSILEWHNKNKSTVLSTYINGVDAYNKSGGSINPLKLIEGTYEINGMKKTTHTDLTGVTVNTPWVSSAGRIVEQKGIENYVNGIEYWCENFYQKGEEVPVFWLNGAGPKKYFDLFLEAKGRIAKKYPEVADRMVCSELFSEAGSYDTIKLVSDGIAMPSNFEPCGLVHKEMMQYSGALGIVNRTGGLVEGLDEGKNVFVSEYRPGDIKYNSESYGKALNEFLTTYKDKEKFSEMMTSGFTKNLDWLAENGSMDKYLNLMNQLNVVRSDLRQIPIS